MMWAFRRMTPTTSLASVDTGPLTRNRRTTAVAALTRDVRTRRACRRTWCSRSVAGGVRSRRACVRPFGLLRAARLRCWRTRLRRVHATRTSPRRVCAFGGARGALALRRHQAARPAASGAYPLLAHAPVACEFGPRIAVQVAHDPQKAVLAGWRQICPGCCERRASASGARAGDVCTWRTRPFAGCLRFVAGQVLSRGDGVRLSWLLRVARFRFSRMR